MVFVKGLTSSKDNNYKCNEYFVADATKKIIFDR